ncbi:MAG: hypothetical protein ACYTBP_17695 [Planctomycetota bacterium]
MRVFMSIGAAVIIGYQHFDRISSFGALFISTPSWYHNTTYYHATERN